MGGSCRRTGARAAHHGGLRARRLGHTWLQRLQRSPRLPWARPLAACCACPRPSPPSPGAAHRDRLGAGLQRDCAAGRLWHAAVVCGALPEHSSPAPDVALYFPRVLIPRLMHLRQPGRQAGGRVGGRAGGWARRPVRSAGWQRCEEQDCCCCSGGKAWCSAATGLHHSWKEVRVRHAAASGPRQHCSPLATKCEYQNLRPPTHKAAVSEYPNPTLQLRL